MRCGTTIEHSGKTTYVILAHLATSLALIVFWNQKNLNLNNSTSYTYIIYLVCFGFVFVFLAY